MRLPRKFNKPCTLLCSLETNRIRHLRQHKFLACLVYIASLLQPCHDGGAVMGSMYLAPGRHQAAALTLWIIIRYSLNGHIRPDARTGLACVATATANGEVVVGLNSVPNRTRDNEFVPVGTLS